MPYLVQVLREYIPKIDSIEKHIKEAEEKKANTPGNFTGEATFEGVPVSVGGIPVGLPVGGFPVGGLPVGLPVGGFPGAGLPVGGITTGFGGFQQNF